MALKDLVADSTKIHEETIEAIVSSYIRYDPKANSIVLTPEGTALSSEQKLLIYLVAVLGWNYVVDDPPSVPTKPADLEVVLGISGGTLRPKLKKLKDKHLISVKDGHYSIQTANLDAAQRIISGERIKSVRARKTTTKTTSMRSSGRASDQNTRNKKRSVGELRTMLEGWVKDGFFEEVRTIRDLHNKYHEHAIIVPQTSLSGLLLRAVRDGLLTRNKVEADGKSVWGYKAKSA